MTNMINRSRARWSRWLIGVSLAVSASSQAEDIDIFITGNSSGSTALPNIMFLVDNSANWSRSAQQWPDNDGKQGKAELQAIQNALAGEVKARVGLAGFTGSGSSVGGYIRFAPRDLTVAANKTALTNILGHIKSDINSSKEKVNDNGEAVAMYEVYKYYKSMDVFRGGLKSGNDPASNVDMAGNDGNPSASDPTAHGQGLTTGHALLSSGTTYQGPAASVCGGRHLVMVINNAQGSIPTGSQTYESTSAGAALPSMAGVGTSWTDEWARFLYQSGITVYVLDAYNAQQNEAHSKVLERAARVGGGKYYAVKNQAQIEFALKEILAEISAVNSTFATASLPISATNRSQNLNQVFIGMFRPDGDAKPRWKGNLKQYQLLKTDAGVDLGDSRGVNAVNLQTGFVTECAVSHWTTDSGSYWEDTRGNLLAKSTCTAFPTVSGVTGSMWSDLPDGPTVEKGGVAEVIRKGNNPATTNASPTWSVSRTIYTYASAAASKLAAITTANSGLSSSLLDWVKGYDDASEITVDGVTSRPYSEFITSSNTARTRPSIHGDVIHSRPLPVNYGGTNGVTVYYGANDGFLRAVKAVDGSERWAFVAPEHMAHFQRLHDNSPLVNYGNVNPALNPLPKNYFFDGSIGLFQKADNSKVWIFPSMRRGGRMLYGFDVTDPADPKLKWRVGCPNLANDTDCTTGFDGIGQTWSQPSVAYLKGESTTTPFVLIGGGYDTCDDTNSSATSCDNSTRKGKGIYVINADTGARVAFLTHASFTGSVPSDLALSDVNGDGSVDYAYAVTTTGEVWRADFSNTSGVAQAAASWGMRKVGYTSGAGRKFLYPPALLRSGTKMFLALGSGDREHPLASHYPYDTQIANRFYVLRDDLSIPHTSTDAAVNMDSADSMIDLTASSTCETAGVTPSSTKKGWFMGLPGRGEQTVTSALIAGGMVTFNTNRATPGSEEACTNPLGEARGYWVNLLNASGSIGVGTASCGGSRSSVFVGGGLTPSPTLASVLIGDQVQTVAIGAAQRSGGSSSGIAPQEVNPSISSKRKTIYWKSNTVD